MKIKLLIISFILILFPFSIKALTPNYDITLYNALYEILENGDVLVTEELVQDGKFNGYEVVLSTKSNLGKSIYNPTNIENISITTNSNPSKLVATASKGDKNKYTVNKSNNDVKIKIFEYTNNGSVKYNIKYTLKNLIVGHNDINEFYYNFLIGINDDMKNPNITVKLPNIDTNLKAFGHGPMDGNVKIIDNKTVNYQISNYNVSNAIDGRILFDKKLVNASKQTNINSFDTILEEEQTKANIANQEREEAKKAIKRITLFLNIVLPIWYIIMISLIIYAYIKYDKEYKLVVKYKYFREIPENLEPGVVEYLDKKDISTKSLVASIMELIRLKSLKIEKIQSNKKDDYQISNNNNDDKLTECQQHLKTWLLSDIGNGQMFLLSDLKKQSNSEESAKQIINNFSTWKNKVKDFAINKNYYEKKPIIFILLGLFMLITSIVFVCIASTYNYPYLFIIIIAIVLASLAFIYFSTFNKRTLKGAVEHNKWMGLKNFLNDFGNFKDKELPEIALWEQYLVYATLFGIADKVIKTMKIKIQDLSLDDQVLYNDPTLFYLYNLNIYNHFSSAITSSINNSISTINIANSNSSSGQGFGGGFSGGGGFGGGGRGGGGF